MNNLQLVEKVLYFIDENGNPLPSDVVIKEGIKLQVEYQGVIENIDIEFIEKGNYSSYFESHYNFDYS